MTAFNGKRLANETLRLDVDGLRRGRYTDKYFSNVLHILEGLRKSGYVFAGQSPRELEIDVSQVKIGEIEVEAQIFNRRGPYALIGGVDVALAMIRHAAGYFENYEFVERWRELEVVAVQDGDMTHYSGNPDDVQTAIEIRGRYADFTQLETPILGVLSRASRIATNVYDVLKEANGKQVLFFPARFDLAEVQSLDGYAYWLAVQRYNHESGHNLRPMVSTDAQAAWWGGRGGGTVPHAIVACFMADTAESMLAFAHHIAVDVPRIVLTDFNNDSVGDSLATLNAFWPRYRAAYEIGDKTAQKRWALNGVRLDTSSNMRDVSLEDSAPNGVSPELVRTVRRAIDNAWVGWDVPASLENVAKEYCKNVQIVVTGGFNREKIRRFESENVPVDTYGVGSTFLSNDKATNTDFTMDVVRVKIDGRWVDMPKVGRLPCDNVDLQPVDLSKL
jgi:nicotinate phosphoribosyltransferase